MAKSNKRATPVTSLFSNPNAKPGFEVSNDRGFLSSLWIAAEMIVGLAAVVWFIS